MYYEVKIPLQELLKEELTGQSLTVRDLIVDKAMDSMLSDDSVSIGGFDLSKPGIMVCDNEIIIHFYPLQQETE